MVSKQRFESVSLEQIDTEDHRYKISTGGPDGSLVAAIEHAGVLNPPVLFPRHDETWIIISGFKRIAALKQLERSETVACILDRKTAPERRIEIAIMDNTAQRELNPVEQGRAILLLDMVYTNSDKLCRSASRLGVPANPKSAQKLRMAARMRLALRSALVNGDVALPVALQLEKMEDLEAADQLTRMIGAVGLGLNRQRELLDWLKGISMREGVSLKAVIDHPQVQKLLGDPDSDRKQKSRMLRDYFRQRRYPQITKAEIRFQEIVTSLKLGTGIRITAPQHFEGQKFSLQISFNSHQELIFRCKELEKVLQSPDIASLWELFRVP